MTAPLLSPAGMDDHIFVEKETNKLTTTDITPKFDYNDWLQPRLSAAIDTPPHVDNAEFTAAINHRTIPFSLALSPSSSSLSLPTRTLPPTGASKFFPNFELLGPQDGTTQFHPTYMENAPASGQEYGYAFDPFFAGFTEDMMIEHAIHNSFIDMVSDRNDNPLDMSNPAPLQEDPIADWTFLDDMDSMQNFPSLSHPGDLSNSAPPEDSPDLTFCTPSTMDYQSSHISPSQWMAVSNPEPEIEHDYEQVYDMTLQPVSASFAISPSLSNSSASLKEVRQGKSKTGCRGAVVKKNHVSLLQSISIRYMTDHYTVDLHKPICNTHRHHFHCRRPKPSQMPKTIPGR